MKAIVNLPLHPIEYFPINFIIHANYFDDDIYLFDLNWRFYKTIELGSDDTKMYTPPKNRILSLRKNESFLHYKQAVHELEHLCKNNDDNFINCLHAATECLSDYEEIFLVENDNKFGKIFIEKLSILYPEKKFSILNDFPPKHLAKLNFFNLDLKKYWCHGRLCPITSKNNAYIKLITSTQKFDAIEFMDLNDVTEIDDTMLTGSYLTLDSDIDQRLDYATLALTTIDIGTKLSAIEDFFIRCRRNRIRLTLHLTLSKHLVNYVKFFKLCKKFNIQEICQIDAKECYRQSLTVNNVSLGKDYFFDFLNKLKKQKLLTHNVRTLHELYTKTKG